MCVILKTRMDKKAKEILFKTYWSSYGWKSDIQTDPKDFEYAKSKGLMFDPITISKVELLKRLDKILNEISFEKITDAFISSLSNKRLDWRSALASYSNAKRILYNENTPDFHFTYGKNIDLNVLNFERIKWGGVRHNNCLYNLLDLELLNKEQVTKPTENDIKIFKDILEYINNSDNNLTPSKLRDNLNEVYKASKHEKHMLIEILSCAEILKPSKFDRTEPNKHDWTFALHWRGEDKFDKEKVKLYFGKYRI